MVGRTLGRDPINKSNMVNGLPVNASTFLVVLSSKRDPYLSAILHKKIKSRRKRSLRRKLVTQDY